METQTRRAAWQTAAEATAHRVASQAQPSAVCRARAHSRVCGGPPSKSRTPERMESAGAPPSEALGRHERSTEPAHAHTIYLRHTHECLKQIWEAHSSELTSRPRECSPLVRRAPAHRVLSNLTTY
ncbi:unnamed protein product [Arctia plantaginis]|uniref:Uncharacterized protein n=1 Tax=Arctia plantaginis TaxID=874455 RepID=A0A8S1AI65_ARCPL|nr:unnamed protein product [Arctia plantaginis]CAB3247392.1 unnamed protein product [Arctia plantaginis]